jgi:hypothetical protein
MEKVRAGARSKLAMRWVRVPPPTRRQRRSTDSRVAMRAKSHWPIGLARAKGSMRTWAPGLIVFFPDFERPGKSFSDAYENLFSV